MEMGLVQGKDMVTGRVQQGWKDMVTGRVTGRVQQGS